MIKPADHVAEVPSNPIRIVLDRIHERLAQGKEAISLCIGEPDFDTPAHIVEAMAEAARKGATRYVPNIGIPELRQAICDKLREDNGLSYAPGDIICTVGVSQGVHLTLSAFLEAGDEILVPDPAWLNYRHVATLCGARPAAYALRPENQYQMDVAELEARVTPRTRMLVLLNPGNPTGSVLRRESLEQVAAFAVRHDLLVVADEIYEKIVYDGHAHHSIAAMPGMHDRTIVLNGFSKAYAMTGWRLGYIAAPTRLIGPMTKIQSISVTSASSMVQWGGVAALRGTQAPLRAMVEEFRKRRDYVCGELKRMPGLSCRTPEGAFYIFTDVRGTGMDGKSFADRLMDSTGVAVVAGTAFGEQATHAVRISYATSMDKLEKAMACVRGFLAAGGR